MLVPVINDIAGRFVTIKQLAKLQPAFPESSTRWLIFNKDKNGFARCVKKIGRKVVIDLVEFEKFVAGGKANG